ncbi:MOSC domain-containing protein [Roseobacter sp. HKCCA0434]|uniref:MOSC domain-containing protein n=1 Tax=Roseobacter sp. HKCCA0434 TaxID=3079297 RepID=UPI002905EBEC|nr:MOSC domain-containing protein [Roseobacter sp. HKCCA0434]
MRVSALWRHPVKGVGAERLTRTALVPGRCLPGDRAFAIAQEGVEADGSWMPCRNFVRGAKAGTLMAVGARTEGARTTFSHPERPELTVRLPEEGARLVDWIAPLYPANRPAPTRLIAATEQGMTDADFPSISILSDASRAELEAKVGHPLDRRRFRGNIWLEGLEPWAEWDWIGRRIRIGGAVLEVRERNTRCRATHSDPVTGREDTDVLRHLFDGWGHRDFGVYAVCIEGGEVAEGDEAALA